VFFEQGYSSWLIPERPRSWVTPTSPCIGLRHPQAPQKALDNDLWQLSVALRTGLEDPSPSSATNFAWDLR